MKKLFKSKLNVALLSAITAGFAAPSASAAYGLMDIYQMALEHDAVLAQAKAKYEANQQVVDIAKSGLLPQVNASAGYGFNDNSLQGDGSKFEYGVSAKQSLYNKATWANYDKAGYSLKRFEFQVKDAEQNVITRVSDAYFKVLIAQEDLSLSKAKEEADKTQWERADASAEVGLASRTDVLQAKSSYDLSKSDRITAENNLDVAYEELMKLTGKSIEDLKVVTLNVSLPIPDLNINAWESRAESDNLAVLQKQEAVNESNQVLELKKAGHWFDLGVQASYSGEDASYSKATNRDMTNFYIGAYVDVPLYSGGKTSAEVSEARYTLKAENESLRDAREQAKLNARVNLRNVERGMALVEALREAVKSNDAFLEAAEEGYKVGLKNLLEVLTARTNKFKARRDLTDALHKVILANLNLQASVGDLNAEKLTTYDAILVEPIR